MPGEPQIDEYVREKIISDPEVVLEDHGIMSVLARASGNAAENNVVDLRGIAMDRLATRLERLEDTHRSVIAAAYENLAGTNQIHRAVIRLMEPMDFQTFLQDLQGDVADILRVDAVQLVLESEKHDDAGGTASLNHVLHVTEVGTAEKYITQGRQVQARPVTLRPVSEDEGVFYAQTQKHIRSEACLSLNFGPDTLPGMLLLGSEDPRHFHPQQGTDLLMFFTGVFESAMRRWLQ